MKTAPIVSKVWSFCTTLRDDGVSYGDYLEQLTYLIFLKMADEYAKLPYNRDVGIPAEFNWHSLRSKNGADLEGHYVALLRALGARPGMLGQIFTRAQNKIQDPAKLFRLIAIGRRHRMGHHGRRRKRGIFTKGSWRKTPKIPNPARASISRRALLSAPWSNVYGPNRASSLPTRHAVRVVSFLLPTTSSPIRANHNLDRNRKRHS